MADNIAQNQRPALPKRWIVPIRLSVYAALAGCSAYVYFNYKEMEITHFFILAPIVIVSAMAALDCKMSTQYWEQQERQAKSSTITNKD